ncbi:MAG: hypothetical protein IJ131_07075 [Eggerthellaceae bacterium]|nr:hypothetical protein [Eggerthellaceae bacterium]
MGGRLASGAEALRLYAACAVCDLMEECVEYFTLTEMAAVFNMSNRAISN